MATHDLTGERYGDDYVITAILDNGDRIELYAWVKGVEKGDDVLLHSGSGIATYRIDRIFDMSKVTGMWRADLRKVAST